MIARVGIACSAAILFLIELSPIASAQTVPTGSEALRAERCAGGYVCDEDGSWAIADMCVARRAAVIAAAEQTRSQQIAAENGRPAGGAHGLSPVARMPALEPAR
jgi:hypothetical protein